MTRSVLVFGASGVIGRRVVDVFRDDGASVLGIARREPPSALAAGAHFVAFDPFVTAPDWQPIAAHGPFDVVVWAQGANLNDSVYDFEPDRHAAIMQANCTYVLATMHHLLHHGLLAKPARMCVVSSIWQTEARPNKLSYAMSKAALQGLVLAASADLAQDGHLINAVLPGVLDTPMTRSVLSPEQMARVEGATLFNRLPQVDDVATMIAYLCSSRNNSTTGQSIAIDLGFRHVHRI